MEKEAQARILINDLLRRSGWRFFDDESGPANIALEARYIALYILQGVFQCRLQYDTAHLSRVTSSVHKERVCLNVQTPKLRLLNCAVRRRRHWKQMKEYLVSLPPGGLLNSLESVIRSTVEQMKTLTFANQKLRAARDLLLPRLMSGEIAV